MNTKTTIGLRGIRKTYFSKTTNLYIISCVLCCIFFLFRNKLRYVHVVVGGGAVRVKKRKCCVKNEKGKRGTKLLKNGMKYLKFAFLGGFKQLCTLGKMDLKWGGEGYDGTIYTPAAGPRSFTKKTHGLLGSNLSFFSIHHLRFWSKPQGIVRKENMLKRSFFWT